MTAKPLAAEAADLPPEPALHPRWPAEVEPTPEFLAAHAYLRDGGGHLFVTGRAGTGKSTLLRCLRDLVASEMVIVAPTGLAAVNVGGQTIHSLFRLPIGVIADHEIEQSAELKKLLNTIETLVVDEVSMVNADLLDAMDRSLRQARQKPHEPFGGVQLVLFGDPLELQIAQLIQAQLKKADINAELSQLEFAQILQLQNEKSFKGITQVGWSGRIDPDGNVYDHVYTGREYVQEMINMRGGDIFMGAFNAEQVMYNHFGYRSPIPNLYNAGSAGHPGGAISGGAGYISAGIIAADLGVKSWWKPRDARAALERLPQLERGAA